ncbi:MAG: hypothetical protein IPK71_13670 [Myxococcales bacterium]|nr:hypothetical protein [Myxococcales bacterium]
MRIASSLLVSLAAVTVLAATVAPSANAQTGGACSPAAPRGYVRAQVESADGTGNATLRFGAEVTGRLKPKAGDAVYLATCNGFRAPGRGSQTEIRQVSGATAKVVFGLPAAQIVGKYVFVDTGYDSEPPLFEGEVRPPSGYVQASITDIQVKNGKTQIAVGASYTDGVFPGAKGYIVNEKGQPVAGGAFVIERLGSEHVTVAMVDAGRDVVISNQQVFVERSMRRCQAPDPVPPPAAELAKTVQGGPAPAGWTLVDVPTTRSSWPQVTLPVGSDQGVVPPAKVWFIVGRTGFGAPLPIVPAASNVESIRASSSVVTAPDNLRSAPFRVLVQTTKCR